MSFEFIYRYWNQAHAKHQIFSVYHWNQNRNKAENKYNSLQQSYSFICLFVFDYMKLFVCLRDRILSKNSKTSLLLQHFQINLWCLASFTYQKIVKPISKTHLTKYEKVSMCSLKCEDISLYEQRRNIFFLKTAHV